MSESDILNRNLRINELVESLDAEELPLIERMDVFNKIAELINENLKDFQVVIDKKN